VSEAGLEEDGRDPSCPICVATKGHPGMGCSFHKTGCAAPKLSCGGRDCGGETTFRRADGRCVCETCRKEYRQHPHCANSALPKSMQSSSVNVEYSLNVLCDGSHVKL
jgi:hypothetical protein